MNIPPWLNHLEVDQRGICVPYINLWGPEDPTRYHMAHDPNVGRQALYLNDTDQTQPDFTKQNFQRQRECMTLGKCQVCHRAVPWSRRYLIVTGFSTETVHVHDHGPATVITEPWLCHRCAQFAIRRCPALIRQRHNDALTLIPVTSKQDVALIVSSGYVDGPLAAQTRETQPAMWVKVALLTPTTTFQASN